MSQTTDRPPAAAETVAYRPLSVLAVAGFAVSALYAAIVVVGGLSALPTGSPLLLPLIVWMGLPLLGVGLSYVARRQIVAAEGTRAGLALATWGWRISLIVGLAYAAFYGATYFVIQGQSDDFARRWINLMRQGKTNQAFLLVMEPNIQQSVNPEDDTAMTLRFDTTPDPGRPGPLSVFRNGEIVRFLRKGEDVVITPLGVREWGYSDRKYKVRVVYGLSHREGTAELCLTVQGTASAKGEYEGRQWMVVLSETGLQNHKLTDLGMQLNTLHNVSGMFLQRWGERMTAGDVEAAYLGLCQPQERDRLHAEFGTRVALSMSFLAPSVTDGLFPAASLGRLASLADRGLVLQAYMPGYKEHVGLVLALDEKKLEAEDDVKPAVVSGLSNLFFPGHTPYRIRGLVPPSNPTVYAAQEADGRVRFEHDMHFGFYPMYRCDARLTVESEPGYTNPNYKGGWRLVKIVPSEAQDVQRGKRRPSKAERMSSPLPMIPPVRDPQPTPPPGKGPPLPQ